MDKGTFKVINYVSMTSDTFPIIREDDPVQSQTSIIRRECRGIIFDNDGNIIRRPYHKFFNVNEREETIGLELDTLHVILQKLDGSMIAPFIDSAGDLRWGTKMVAEEFEQAVGEYVKKNFKYIEFARDLIGVNITPIFEWMSRDSKIVVDYPDDALVLTAARHMFVGDYVSRLSLEMVAERYNIPLVGMYPGNVRSMDKLLSETSLLVGEEGYVIRYSNGHMAKVKSDWYLAIHKAKDKILYERYVVDMIINNQMDDVLAHLPESDRKRIEQYQDQLIHYLVDQTRSVRDISYDVVVKQGVNRKTFALNHASSLGPYAAIVYRHFDDLSMGAYTIGGWHDVLFNEIQQMWLKNCTANSKLESFKKAVGCTIEL